MSYFMHVRQEVAIFWGQYRMVKNIGGKKPWRIETNSPKFFSPILVYLDEIRARVIWHIRIRKVSKCLWSKALAFEWWLTCDYKCSTGWLNSIEQSLRKNKIGFNALAHGAYCMALALLNRCLCIGRVKPYFTWTSCDKQPKTWFSSASHKVTVARYTQSSIECALKYASKPWICQRFFHQCFKSTHFAKVFTTKVFYFMVCFCWYCNCFSSCVQLELSCLVWLCSTN